MLIMNSNVEREQYIGYFAAFAADKVDMGADIRIISFVIKISNGQFTDKHLFLSDLVYYIVAKEILLFSF